MENASATAIAASRLAEIKQQGKRLPAVLVVAPPDHPSLESSISLIRVHPPDEAATPAPSSGVIISAVRMPTNPTSDAEDKIAVTTTVQGTMHVDINLKLPHGSTSGSSSGGGNTGGSSSIGGTGSSFSNDGQATPEGASVKESPNDSIKVEMNVGPSNKGVKVDLAVDRGSAESHGASQPTSVAGGGSSSAISDAQDMGELLAVGTKDAVAATAGDPSSRSGDSGGHSIVPQGMVLAIVAIVSGITEGPWLALLAASSSPAIGRSSSGRLVAGQIV
eukprot:TRINITY_DN22197_c0_g1_i1.p1 TRINITY_DN22197_c0_g1~~TRINITY_DN22197_c0_g1_i1.p1  ORF type:complete len:319 (+),score=56.94 TRINITY_DN22197_c0_g1_i1:127-957(+)